MNLLVFSQFYFCCRNVTALFMKISCMNILFNIFFSKSSPNRRSRMFLGVNADRRRESMALTILTFRDGVHSNDSIIVHLTSLVYELLTSLIKLAVVY